VGHSVRISTDLAPPFVKAMACGGLAAILRRDSSSPFALRAHSAQSDAVFTGHVIPSERSETRDLFQSSTAVRSGFGLRGAWLLVFKEILRPSGPQNDEVSTSCVIPIEQRERGTSSDPAPPSVEASAFGILGCHSPKRFFVPQA
jgi:hypothetical protein